MKGDEMTSIVVVYHTGMGHTRAIGESIARGAERVEGVSCDLVCVDDLINDGALKEQAWTKLDSGDAIIFGSPTYMGTVSAPFKAFMDASGSRWFSRAWMDKLAAGFTVGGGLSGDKNGTLSAMQVFASQHGMIWVSMGIGVGEEGVDRLSSSIGMMAQADDGSPEETPPGEDHATAELFGRRVAFVALRWAAS